ncbi:MAG: transcriptional repressor [Desulfocurvibacter africanus]
MCVDCDFPTLLRTAGLSPTCNRLAVLAVLTRSAAPLTTREVLDSLDASAGAAMNRVTVYRILELLAHKGVLTRLACPDRVDRYCLGVSPLHPSHAHFYCQKCGNMRCLQPDSVRLETDQDASLGQVEAAQVLLAGTCSTCLSRRQ